MKTRFRRLIPISPHFGFDRGQPIDRYYIEMFLAENGERIRGRVLEVAEDTYTWRFGGSRVEASDVIALDPTNASATIVADITNAPQIPADRFDCVLFTQTLHLIFDVRAALATIHRILKPGGVLLATFPGTSQVEWVDRWFWGLTAASTRRLLEEYFLPDRVEIGVRGNTRSAAAFLQGLASHEVGEEALNAVDPPCELLLTVRAEKEL